MANMSYCRMENTASALADCVNNWNEKLSSSYEKSGKKRIVALAREIIEMEENPEEEENEEEEEDEVDGKNPEDE